MRATRVWAYMYTSLNPPQLRRCVFVRYMWCAYQVTSCPEVSLVAGFVEPVCRLRLYLMMSLHTVYNGVTTLRNITVARVYKTNLTKITSIPRFDNSHALLLIFHRLHVTSMRFSWLHIGSPYNFRNTLIDVIHRSNLTLTRFSCAPRSCSDNSATLTNTCVAVTVLVVVINFTFCSSAPSMVYQTSGC